MTERLAPEFEVGDRVRVRLSERNRTAREGEVARIIWHANDARWNFYLTDRGRRVHKRYFADDLEPLPGRTFNPRADSA